MYNSFHLFFFNKRVSLRFSRALCLACLFFTSSITLAQQRDQFELLSNRSGTEAAKQGWSISPKEPDWIEKRSFSLDTDENTFGESVNCLLIDRQVSVQEQSSFVKIVSRIENDSGVQEGSTLKWCYDPTYQTLKLHSIIVHRGDISLNKLERAQFHLLQQEKELDQYLYNGNLSLVTFLEDVRKGDIIEQSYSIVGTNPIFKGKFDDLCALQSFHSSPNIFYRIVAPHDFTFAYQTRSEDLQPTVRELSNNTKEWVWEVIHPAKYEEDPQIPTWHTNFAYVQATEYADWGDVAQWGTPLYALPKEFSPEMVSLVDKWKTENTTDKSRALAALRFVQDEVRYLGYEFGVHSHLPTDPNKTLNRRYGDCKAKVLLLLTFLNLMDIESHPALVDINLRDHLSEMLPSPSRFNHVLLQIRLGDKTYWVDPTEKLQGGSLEDGCAGWCAEALVLAPETTGTIVFDHTDHNSSFSEISTFDIEDQEENEEIKLSIETTFKGFNANYFRYSLDNIGLNQLERSLKTEYVDTFGSLETIAPIKIEDDREDNIVKITQEYLLHNPWELDEDKKMRYLYYRPTEIKSTLAGVIDPNRRSPLALKHPSNIVEVFRFPGFGDGTIVESQEEHFVESDAMRFHHYSRVVDGELESTFKLKTHSDHVLPEQIENHRKKVKEITDLSGRMVSFYLGDPIETQPDDFPWMTAGVTLLGIIITLVYFVRD